MAITGLFWPFAVAALVAAGSSYVDPHVLRQLAYALWAYGAVVCVQSFL